MLARISVLHYVFDMFDERAVWFRLICALNVNAIDLEILTWVQQKSSTRYARRNKNK